MSEKKISYLDRTFEDYRSSLLNYVKSYYPQLSDSFEDATIGSWLIDMAASIGDNLSYHTDRVYNETNLESATQRSSVMNIARSNGLKVPGPKASIAEEKFSCFLPVSTDIANDSSTVGMPNWAYAPVIKKGTKLTSGSQFFEVMNDIDFKEAFDENGVLNRNIIPQTDANGKIKNYRIEKLTTVQAGETRVYKQVISSSDIRPFMEIIIPDANVMNVESIIFKEGTNYNSDPSMAEFMMQKEYVSAADSPSRVNTYRFFEVNSLVEQYRWGDAIGTDSNKAVSYTYGYSPNSGSTTVIPTASVTKGEWIPLTQKFITEYTDNGYLRVIFGPGEIAGQQVDISGATDFSKYQITKMIRNNFMGRLPKPGWTMYIQYRVGGGTASNVPKGRINSFAFLSVEIGKCIPNGSADELASAIRDSLRCENTTPSVSGKDAPSVDEIKNMIKYNSGAQERCVTIKDYLNRIMMMPPRYGCPFRIGAIEENNKIMVYLLGIDSNRKLTSDIPTQLLTNIEDYLSMYRMINDFVEIKSGRIINVSFEVDIYVDKNYNASDVVRNVINVIKDYMDINNHELGEDIYVSDIEKEILKTDGVLNIIDLKIFNEYGPNYSSTRCSQDVVDEFNGDSQEKEADRDEIALDSSDYTLVSDSDEMFEIKNPESDIKLRVKLR